MSHTPLERPPRPQESWVWAEGPRQQPPDEYFTGQSTSAQLLGLSELKQIAALQRSAVESASSLLVRHPRNFFATAWRLRGKLLLAGMNGLIAFLFGLGVQTAFIRLAGASYFTAYVLQTIFSTQLSFLLNRYLTWRDRRVRFFPTLVRYNLQQASTVLLGIIAFAGLDQLGVQYALANLMVTLIIAPLTFLLSHKWSIAERETAYQRQAVSPASAN